MLGRLLALVAVLGPAAWLLDRWLAARDGGTVPPIETLEVIDAPIEATWAVVGDVPRQLEWMRDMKSMTIETPGPIRVGSTATALVRVLGVPVRDPVEITDFTPPTRYAIRHAGIVSGTGTITLEAGADATTTIVRWEERLRAPVLPHLAGVIQNPILRAVFQADLHRLRRLVEAGQVDTLPARQERRE